MFEVMFSGNHQFSLATFNLLYNLIYTLILLLLIDPLVNLVTKLIKDKEEKMKELLYIDESFLQTPAVAIEQALKELHYMLLLARKNIARSFSSLINEDMSESKEIADVEYRIDFLTGEITSFLIKISSITESGDDEKLIGGLHHVANDIERLGDYAVLIIKETNYMKQKEVKFLEQTKSELNEIYELISKMFDLGFETFTLREIDNLEKIGYLHKEIENLIASTREEHVHRLGSGMYPVEVSKSIYSVLFSLQRISDHIVNIAFSILSTTGSKTEAMEAIEKGHKIIA